MAPDAHATTQDEHNGGFPDWADAQSISGSNIDPAKLTMLLRIKFGGGAYDFHVSTASSSGSSDAQMWTDTRRR